MNYLNHNLAIAIGINNYSNGLAKLTTARPDAETLANLLKEKYDYQVKLITDQTDLKPTLNEIRNLLNKWLPQQLQSPDHNNRLLFYFAGHGMSPPTSNDPQGFLLPQNANPNPKPGESNNFLSMQELHDALIALPCHHLLVILDCCFAGTFRWSSTRQSIPIPETIHRQHYDRFIRYPAWQVITSSAHNQEALDFLSDKRGIGKDEQHSPFAEALFEALQDGEPDKNGKRYKKADLTKDGVITAPELYLYLRDNVENRSGERQTPGLFPLRKHDRGEFIFHDPDFDPSTLSEAPELDETNNPYRGLKPFEERHARFFFGRQELIDKLYTHIAAPDCPLTVVLGISGSGKSSIVKAGLIPYLKNGSQPETFSINLIKACIFTSAILHTFSSATSQHRIPPKFLPINYCNPWKVLSPIRPGESPFSALARTLMAIADTPVSPQVNQLDFLIEHLQLKLEQLNTEIDQVVSQEKISSSQGKQLQRDAETFTQLLAEFKDASSHVRQRSLVEHFEELYALCQTTEPESEQQKRLRQTFQDCLAPLTQKLQSDPESLVAIVRDWQQKNPGVKLLLVIDQFEELITLGRTPQTNHQDAQPEEWQQFLQLLGTTLSTNLPQLRILVTLRSDFEPRFLNSETLKPYWSKARFPVRAMRSDELRQAIENPASKMALYFEPANLVDRLIDEVGQMPGALPLLSFTLSELYVNLANQWRNQEVSDRALTIGERFDSDGGVAGSLTRRANEEYQKIGENPNLGEAAQHTMRKLMLRMLILEGGKISRRQVPDSELIYSTQQENERVKHIINRLVEARLVVKGQGMEDSYVEVAHDFLVQGWQKLQDWKDDNHEVLMLQQRLIPDTVEWYKNDQNDEYLWIRNPRLAFLEKVLESKSDNWLNQLETAFIQTSKQKRLDELEETKKLLKISEERRLNAELREQAARVQYLLSFQPIEMLLLAIQTVANNLNGIFINSSDIDIQKTERHKILSVVQQSLHTAIEEVKIPISFMGHSGAVNSVAFSPHAQLVVSASNDGTIRFWDFSGKAIRQPLQICKNGVLSSIVFSPNGKFIAVSAKQEIYLFNIEGNFIGQPFRGHKKGINSIAFSPDSQLIASASADTTIHLWNINGQIIKILQGHTGTVYSVAFSPDGEKIVSGGWDKKIYLWDKNGNQIRQYQGHEKDINSVCFSSDGEKIVSGSGDKTIRLWNINESQTEKIFQGHEETVRSVSFSPDGQLILSSSSDKTVRLWDIQDNVLLKTFGEYKHVVNSVAFSPDGQRLVSGDNDAIVRLWDIRNTQVNQSFQINNEIIKDIRDIAISSNGHMIAGACSDKKIRLWSIDGKLFCKPFEGHERFVNSVAFSPNGKYILSGSDDKTLRLWDLEGNLIGSPFEGHTSYVYSVAFSPNGNLIASGSRDKTIRLWDIYGNPVGSPWKGHKNAVYSVTFSPNGKLIASGSEDRTIRLWDNKGNFVRELAKHTDKVHSVAFSQVGHLIVSGSADGTIRLWDINGIPQGQPFRGHEHTINSVAFSPDGHLIVSGSADRTIRIWDLNGNPVAQTLKGHKHSVTSVTYSPDGKMIVSSSRDGTIRFWLGNWNEWLNLACDRLRHHPVFTNPESIENLEQREIAIIACKTCKKYVWNEEDDSG
jgi:WD40 repeat protein